MFLRVSPRLYASLNSSVHRVFCSLPDHEILKMPLLSPTMEHGTIVKWLKAEGEEASAGDTLLEIETDKASMGFEVQDDIILAKILAPDGTAELPVGEPIAVLVDEADHVAAFADYVFKSDAKQQQPPADDPTPPAAATDNVSYPDHETLGMPLLSPTMEKGTLVKWLAKEGDVLAPGDSLFEVETDKATMSYEV
jgi:pyruvate dehydrogenase E2 component (dihydrolipoamide acetyltransferase)